MEGSELMLVDFGRAVDITRVSEEISAVDVKFLGEATRRDMRCVAMRVGKSWSFDVDTYGLLCSAHVLLYGTHMDITKGEDGQWQPVTKFRRYWQRSLWKDIFYNLLNLDEASGAPMHSIPRSLGQLRKRIDDYLDHQRSQLHAAMFRQANLLPPTRDQLC